MCCSTSCPVLSTRRWTVQLLSLIHIFTESPVDAANIAAILREEGIIPAAQLAAFTDPVSVYTCLLYTAVLVERTQSFTLGQSLGFGLGSVLGYVLAVLLVTEARHRLRSRAIPKAFPRCV